ncbi:MAG: hypothetical protein QMC93_00305 [Patescibacteria group bacterium]|nr:hypothetical protein [Patescibacteria group bacterium]
MANQEETNNQGTGGAIPGAELLGPGGVMMLFIAGVLDLLLIASTILIILVGVGVIFGKIVNGIAFATIGLWQLLRSGTFSTKKEKRSIGWDLTKKFFKKHLGKLAASLIHFPTYTYTVYSELKSS